MDTSRLLLRFPLLVLLPLTLHLLYLVFHSSLLLVMLVLSNFLVSMFLLQVYLFTLFRLFVLVSVTVCTTFGDTSVVSVTCIYILNRTCNHFVSLRLLLIVDTSRLLLRFPLLVLLALTRYTCFIWCSIVYPTGVGDACSIQLPCVHVPSSSVFVTLFRLFVLVSVTVCTHFW